MNQRYALLFLGFLALSCSTRVRTPAHSLRSPSSNACTMKNDCVQNILRDILRIYRPSGEEDQIRDYIKRKITAALPRWSDEKPSLEEDKLGNLLVRLPATGQFVNQKLRPIVLQSHFDMIHAVKGAKAGEDLRNYFINGVDLVEEADGWWHSRDFATSLGADNGTGIALALAYGIDPSIEHPPLYLLFTVQEETGLKGALGLQFPLDQTIILNLDSLDGDKDVSLVRGGNGGNSNRIKGKVAAVPLPEGWQILEISITGLLGGHSAHDIAKPRVNSLVLLSRIFAWLNGLNMTASIASARAGQLANQIPANLEVKIAIAPQQIPDKLKEMVTEVIEKEICRWQDECLNQKKQIKVTMGDRPAESIMLSADLSSRLMATIGAMPNGVLYGDPALLDGTVTSNNVGALIIEPTPGSMNLHTEFAFFARSFNNQHLKDIVDTVSSAYYGLFPAGTLTTTNNLNVFGWSIDEKNWLVQLALGDSDSPFAKATLSSASNESGVLASKYSGISILSLGARVQNAHTANEKLDINSFVRLDSAVKNLLLKIGTHPNGVQP